MGGTLTTVVMANLNPIKGITSKLWLQAKITYWKIRLVTSGLMKN
ncbi:MAG TPA: hypothetical protein VK528_02970 [Flavobacterium sp.]|nr:hypothetical protein [Flavobacterium sp.]